MNIKKAIVIDDCVQCPNWQKCKPSKVLNSKQRMSIMIGIGVPKGILKGCPLPDYVESKNH